MYADLLGTPSLLPRPALASTEAKPSGFALSTPPQARLLPLGYALPAPSTTIPRPGAQTPASGLEFWGGSFIADPFGRILAQASHDREEILTATLDPALIETTRQHWPFLRDRRIDAYTPITRRFVD
jgi:predicted amidohydrolase